MRGVSPWRSFVLETRLTPMEVEVTLCEHLSPGWDGVVTAGRLEMVRRIGYQNSFLPRVTALIEPLDEDGAAGSRLRVVMSMHLFVKIFMCVWMAFSCLMVTGYALAVLRRAAPIDATAAILVALPLLGAALTIGGFVPEARRAERFLRDLLPPVEPRRAAYR